MKVYLSLLRVRFLNGLQYRAAAIGGLITQFFWGIMLVFIYRAFYDNASYPADFPYRELVTYVWLQQAFLSFIFLYDWDNELLDMIMTGNVSYELCRPLDLYRVWYVKLLSKRLAGGSLRFSPVIILGFIMPYPYNLSLPAGISSFILFIVTLLLGLMLLVTISMLIYISVFKTMSPIGSVGIFTIVGEFFSGMTIPLPFMPPLLQKICIFLPFRWTADFPLRVYAGNISISQALVGIAVQIVWIVVLFSLGSVFMKRITRLTTVQGG